MKIIIKKINEYDEHNKKVIDREEKENGNDGNIH